MVGKIWWCGVKWSKMGLQEDVQCIVDFRSWAWLEAWLCGGTFLGFALPGLWHWTCIGGHAPANLCCGNPQEGSHQNLLKGKSLPRSTTGSHHPLLKTVLTYRSIQVNYRQTFSLQDITFQLQMQSGAARRINFDYRGRSVGMSAESVSLQIQILSGIPINFHYRYSFRAQSESILSSFLLQRYTIGKFCTGSVQTGSEWNSPFLQ